MASWINLLDCIYPVGSIYCSISSTSPASIIGGTWSAIAGGACLGAADGTFTANNYGGSQYIAKSSLPKHTHEAPAPTGYEGGYGYMVVKDMESESTARRYFNTASNGTQVMISAYTAASDYDGIQDITAYTDSWYNQDGGGTYYPYQFNVYMWVRTA